MTPQNQQFLSKTKQKTLGVVIGGLTNSKFLLFLLFIEELNMTTALFSMCWIHELRKKKCVCMSVISRSSYQLV